MSLIPPGTKVDYSFVAVYRIVGFSEVGKDQVISLPPEWTHVNCYLTSDPDRELTKVDKKTAISGLMLRALFDSEYPSNGLTELIQANIDEIRAKRIKEFPVPGVYIVTRINGIATTLPIQVSREYENAILTFDAIDRRAIMDEHRPTVSTMLMAVSLAIGHTTPDIKPLIQGIELTLQDGRELYSFTLTGGMATLTTSRPVVNEDTTIIGDWIKLFSSDARFRSPGQLLVDALSRPSNSLTAFILAWASLDMMVKKFTVGCESGDWVSSVSVGLRATAETIHDAHIESGHKSYGLADRVRVLCMLGDAGDINELAGEVGSIRKANREPLYHEGKVDEQMPVERVVKSIRRLITIISVVIKKVN